MIFGTLYYLRTHKYHRIMIYSLLIKSPEDYKQYNVTSTVDSGVSGMPFRGAGQNIFGNVGVFVWRETPCIC